MGRDGGKDLYKGVLSYLYAHLILYHIVISNAVDKESLDYHFSLLKLTLEDNNLMNKACYIYNMDETGMPLGHKQPKHITPKGERVSKSSWIVIRKQS